MAGASVLTARDMCSVKDIHSYISLTIIQSQDPVSEKAQAFGSQITCAESLFETSLIWASAIVTDRVENKQEAL